jgi:hypothetical protein
VLDLPLDISDGQNFSSIPARDLQRSYVNALRLERNWSKEASDIKGMHRIEVGDIVSQMQFLERDLLMAVSRGPTSTSASLWHIADPERPRLIISFPTQTVLSFAASAIRDRNEVIFAIINGAAS